MFNCLQICSTTRSMLRCKQCKSILFGQDQITQFMAYDPNDFGKLHDYAHHKKFQGEADFFLLTPKYDFYSSFKIDYAKSLRLEYHPFFMMHMLLTQCAKCQAHLGYQVETVNENTRWMEGRIIIDASKCSIMKEAKDQMSKVVKNCRMRLVNKLESGKSFQKKPQIDLRERYQTKFQSIKISNRRTNKTKDQQKRDKVSRDLKRRGISVQSTKGQTSLLYKDQKSSALNYTINDFTFKTYDLSYGAGQISDHADGHLKNTESMASISNEKIQRNTKQIDSQNPHEISLTEFVPIKLPYRMREKLNNSLQHWRQRTLEKGKILTAYPIIQKIEQYIWKLDAFERLLSNKIIEQHIRIEKISTKVRQNILEEKKTLEN